MSEPEHYPAFEDSQVKVLEGKTISKGQGWWTAILLVETYGKVQVKWYLWQEKEDKNTHVKSWKRKQSWTVNPYTWGQQLKITEEYLAKRKTRPASPATPASSVEKQNTA
jgi:hypothetical protein